MRRKARFALAVTPALVGALALSPGAQAKVKVTVGRAAPVRQVAHLGVRTGLALNKGARHRPRVAGAVRHAALAPPRVASSALLAAAAPTVGPNFNGTSSRDSADTNFLGQFEPPDQGLCVGNGFVVDMVNSAYTVYNTSGTKLAGPFNLNGPFDEGLREFTSDPRCYFDASTHTWFATVLFISTDADGNFTDHSHLDIAVNTSGDPRKLWRNYQIDTTDAGAPPENDCPCFGDQPRLGIDSTNLYVTDDNFSILGPEFNGVDVYAIAKKDLVGGAAAPHIARFRGLQDADSNPVFGIQPAIVHGSSTAEYLLNALDFFGAGDNRIEAWTITNRGAVAAGHAPTLSGPRTMTSESYANPPGAEQKGSADTLDSGDDRMQQVQFINGSIWGELDTAVAITGETTLRAGAAWFELKPGAGGGLGGTRITRQGYVASKGNYIIYPAVQATPDGHAVMGFSYSGPTRFPSTAFSVLAPGATAFGPVTVSANGTSSYNDASGFFRWGDYSFAILDPSGNGVWAADEYVPPVASQTTNRDRNWGTRVFKVTP